MELEENHQLHLHACKRSRDSNGSQGAKIRRKDDPDDSGIGNGKASRIMSWQHIPSSRIYRVSRASGGKDRHSKVYTAKGLRDRRVRLSVSTAIQFYDLQDRLGYDQPSKAIEWLIKAAAGAIDGLPSLDSFMNLPHFGEDENPIVAEPEADPSSYSQQLQQHVSSKSGCSSPSDTSKGSVLSLSRSESRVQARERARERVAKEKDKDEGSHVEVVVSHQQSFAPKLNSQTSFTELLTGGGSGRGRGRGRSNDTNATVIAAAGANSSPNGIQKQISTADYFSQAGIFSQSQKSHQHLTSGFSLHSPFESSTAMAMMPFNIAAGDHSELQQFSILQDNIMPVSAMPAAAAAGDYNLNFTIAPGLAGFSRGTLQSNSPTQLHQHHSHIQRLTSVEGSNLPFFFGAAVASAAPTSVDHQFSAGFDGRLQLCYGDGFRHSDLKGKGKS